MNKVREKLRLIQKFQTAILVYLGLLAVLMVITAVSPDKQIILGIVLVVFWVMFLVIPFSLFVMVFSLQVFKVLPNLDPRFRAMSRFAGWASVIGGAYILTSFLFYAQVSEWAFIVGRNSLVVAFQSSPVISGLLLLAIHVFVVRRANALLKDIPADQ